MTTIIVTDEDNEIDEFEFESEQSVISIGRRSTNDVCISNLAVSGLHARITIDGDSARVEDLNSTNGTYVNGRLISRQLLDSGDEIVIGKARVSVQLPAALQTEPAQVAAAEIPTAEVLEEEHPRSAANQAANELSQANDQFDSSFNDDDSFIEENFNESDNNHPIDDAPDDQPMTLSEKAKLALGRNKAPRPTPRAASATSSAAAAASRAFDTNDDVAVAEAPTRARPEAAPAKAERVAEAHPLDDVSDGEQQKLTHDLDKPAIRPTGAVIEIQNGAKSGQVLPIDKPVTTLGRPGIQIAAIMRKPDGYFLMHIESDESVDLPTLNQDSIGDEPVLLHSGDKLNVAGIDVEFMLS